MKKSFVLFALLLAGACLATQTKVSFQACKASISCNGEVEMEKAQLLEEGCSLGFAKLETVPVKLEQKGKSYVGKGQGVSAKYNPQTRKFVFKRSFKNSKVDEVSFWVVEMKEVEYSYVYLAQNAVISANGILMDDLDLSRPVIYLAFDTSRPSPMDLLFPLAQKGKKYFVKGSLDDMDYNYVLTPKNGTVKLTVKGGPFLRLVYDDRE